MKGESVCLCMYVTLWLVVDTKAVLNQECAKTMRFADVTTTKL